MIVNVAYPRNGTQKIWKLDDEKIFSKFYDKKIGQEVDADFIAPEFKGYVVKITGGSDKNGFCMKQGVNTKNMVRLLLKEGSVGYFCKREGCRKRRTVRGCIVGPGIAAVNCIIFKKGEGEIAGLTDKSIPRKLGPKRANKIRKLFNLPRHSQNIGVENPKPIKVISNDVCRLVVRRLRKTKGEKKYYKAPKIQRLVTKDRIRRKISRRKEKLEKVRANAKAAEEFRKKYFSQGADAKKDDKKPDAKKADDKKADTKKADAKKDEPKKADTKKAEPKKDEPKKAAEPKKDEPKKAEAKKEEPKKAEPKKEEPKKAAEPKKDDKKAEPKKDAKPAAQKK